MKKLFLNDDARDNGFCKASICVFFTFQVASSQEAELFLADGASMSQLQQSNIDRPKYLETTL